MSIREIPCSFDSKWQFIPKTSNCPSGCGEHGSCDEDNKRCVCRDGYTGDTCSNPPTPPNPPPTTSSLTFYIILLIFLVVSVPTGIYLYKKWKNSQANG